MKDLLFYGGPILTMQAEQDGPAARAEAVLVRGDKIAAVGSLKALREMTADAQPVNLQGCCLLPGFLDAHSHFLQYANTLQFCQLGRCTSWGDVQQALRDFIARAGLKPGQPVVGFGYDQNIMHEGKHPTRQVLDEVSTESPIMCAHASGHMGVANSAMLKLMGLTDDTPDPQGGRYGRDAEGHLDGLLEENAFIQRQALPQGDPGDKLAKMTALLEQAQDIYFSYGITTAQEGMLDPDSFEVYRAAGDAGKLKMDVIGYADMRNCPDLPAQFPAYLKQYKNHFKMGGYKIFLDGSPQGRTAWMLDDYADEPGYRGYPVYEDAQVDAYVQKAQAEDMPLLCHCNGDAAAAQFIRCHRQPSAQRDVMIHSQLLHADQMPAMKAAGIMPSFFPAHTWYWGDAHIHHMGYDRASKISAAASAKALGLPYTFHMDTPVLPPDCLDILFCVTNRVTRDGVKLDQSEALSTYDALKGITCNAAWQYYEEDTKGTLAPGKLADLVILSEDPTAIDPADLRRIKVLATIKGGETVFRKV